MGQAVHERGPRGTVVGRSDRDPADGVVAVADRAGDVARVVPHLSEGQDGETLQRALGVVCRPFCSFHGRFGTALRVQQIGEPTVDEGSTTPAAGPIRHLEGPFRLLCSAHHDQQEAEHGEAPVLQALRPTNAPATP